MPSSATPTQYETVTNTHRSRNPGRPAASTPVRWAVFAAAVVTVFAGAAALVRSGLGADPYGAFITSFTRFGVSPGVATGIFTAAAIAASYAAGLRPRAGTIAGAAGVVLFDVFWNLFEPYNGPALFAAGLITVAVAAGVLAATDLGPGAPEALILTAVHHGAHIRVATWTRDLLFVAIAAALGGAVGIGTIICAAAFSPLFSYTYRHAAAMLGTTPDKSANTTAPDAAAHGAADLHT